MVSRRGKDELSHIEIGEVSHAASDLTGFGCYLSSQHLQDYWTRMQFNRELAYYARRIVNDVEERRLSPEEGLAEIQGEKRSLWSQATQIVSKTAGTVGGIAQIGTGGVICYSSAGLLCVAAGLPFMAHGANNVYENTRALIEKNNDVVGPVKQVYQSAAVAMGYSEGDGRRAYLIGDLALSGYGMTRAVLKPDAWRLFRYMSSDKEMAVKQMGFTGLGLEAVNNINSMRQLGEGVE